MRQSTQRLVAPALILATASILATAPARAGAIININQVGTDVVVTGGRHPGHHGPDNCRP